MPVPRWSYTASTTSSEHQPNVVRRRLPQALQVTLHDSGHLHWLQNEAGYREALHHFYSKYRQSVI